MVRKVIDLKQELTVANQRVYTLDKKCMNFSSEEATARIREEELRRELETLREDKLLEIRPPSSTERKAPSPQKTFLDRENQELRNEIERLMYELETLKSRKNVADTSRQFNEVRKSNSNDDSANLDGDSIINNDNNAKLEERCAMLNREKKSFEDILEQ